MRRRPGRNDDAYRRIRATILAAGPPCWICLEPINPTVRWPSRLSGTIDHVVPLSMGGHPHDLSNLKPAHLGCNSRRGNRDVAVDPPSAGVW